MNNKRKQLIDWYSQSQIEKGDIETALLVAEVRPTHAAWLRLIDRLMLWGGLMAMSVAMMFSSHTTGMK
ncbi:hypothetical protein [Veronia nyctiphanis]|uniref:hypothetical protein n=1 Tax=Veronia nyctiphanis TaxID=1278244 RepID=UPI0013755767|nr:hypothetical protein [Veronia nyctiphanis]